jgi:hypothetical protein
MVGKARRRRGGRPRRVRRAPSAGLELPTLRLERIRLRLQGWFLRTLQLDATREYGKLRLLLEFFLRQSGEQLSAQLWDRGTEIAVEEALQHLSWRWGPKFRQPLEMEVRVTDTHLKFSLNVPPSAVETKKKSLTTKQRQRREAAAERSLYVIKRLVDRLHFGPAGRQLVFWRLLRRSWPLGVKKRGRVE